MTYKAKTVIDSLPTKYKGTVATSTANATVAGTSIPTNFVVDLYGEGTAYSASFIITQVDATRLGFTAATLPAASVTLTLDGNAQTVRLIGSQPFSGGVTRFDCGPTI